MRAILHEIAAFPSVARNRQRGEGLNIDKEGRRMRAREDEIAASLRSSQ